MTDYISRDAVLDALCKASTPCFSSTGKPILVFDVDYVPAINSIHAADVRPVVKSKWADNRVSFYRGCPECGAFVRANLDEVFLRDFPSAVGKLNFCPNCGAMMEES